MMFNLTRKEGGRMKTRKGLVGLLLMIAIIGNVTGTAMAVSTRGISNTVICIHFHYPLGWKIGDPLPQKDIQMIEKAKDLNAKYVRFDIWWKDVEPQKD